MIGQPGIDTGAPAMRARCQLLTRHAIRPALDLLGADVFGSPRAIALMLAIAMQESRIQHRAQIGGPARGFYQFERGGGVAGVLNHPATSRHARAACEQLLVEPSADAVYAAIQYNDILASVFARLLLWAAPGSLPGSDGGPDDAWNYYLAQWRPGKPHVATWAGFWELGWSSIEWGSA